MAQVLLLRLRLRLRLLVLGRGGSIWDCGILFILWCGRNVGFSGSLQTQVSSSARTLRSKGLAFLEAMLVSSTGALRFLRLRCGASVCLGVELAWGVLGVGGLAGVLPAAGAGGGGAGVPGCCCGVRWAMLAGERPCCWSIWWR